MITPCTSRTFTTRRTRPHAPPSQRVPSPCRTLLAPRTPPPLACPYTGGGHPLREDAGGAARRWRLGGRRRAHHGGRGHPARPCAQLYVLLPGRRLYFLRRHLRRDLLILHAEHAGLRLEPWTSRSATALTTVGLRVSPAVPLFMVCGPVDETGDIAAIIRRIKGAPPPSKAAAMEMQQPSRAK